MLTLYTLWRKLTGMEKSNGRPKPVDWDALELQAFNLKFARMSPGDRVKQAQSLATTFRKHNEPLPDTLEEMLRGEAALSD
jgi:hypothetical protein